MNDINNYYVAWIPPNPEFPDKHCKGTECNSYQKAQRIADKLNRETKGSLGKYEPRKMVISPKLNEKYFAPAKAWEIS